jgi:cytochrome c-type biogenesis protein CcmE
MTPPHKRSWYVALIFLFFAGATLVILATLNNHLLFFMTPSDLMLKKPTTPVRLGGIVEQGSLQRNKENLSITFRVMDGRHKVTVQYEGITPDLFREGQAVVAEGTQGANGIFKATRLLAKHDENYMPREVAEALRSSGEQDTTGQKCP